MRDELQPDQDQASSDPTCLLDTEARIIAEDGRHTVLGLDRPQVREMLRLHREPLRA